MPNQIKSEFHTVTTEEINTFRREGVLLLKGVFRGEWLELLRIGMDFNLANPGVLSRFYTQNEARHEFFYDTLNWSRIPELKKFIFDSPAASIVGQLMQSTQVRLLNDTVFFRSHGTQTRTPFHQDMPYWCVSGDQTCSLWMPLVSVRKESALEFVPGSHRWTQSYERPHFGDQDSHGVDSDEGDEQLPEIEGNRDKYGVTAWDMEPGDGVIFHANIIHGGSGNLLPDQELKVVAINWIGDDIRVKIRPGGMDPDLSYLCALHGLREGDALHVPAFPLVWEEA